MMNKDQQKPFAASENTYESTRSAHVVTSMRWPLARYLSLSPLSLSLSLSFSFSFCVYVCSSACVAGVVFLSTPLLIEA